MRTGPYLVTTVVPSTIGSRSRCTPSRETSGPLAALAAGDLVDLVEEDDAGLLDPPRAPRAPTCCAVDELLGLLGLEHLARLGDRHLLPPLAARRGRASSP